MGRSCWLKRTPYETGLILVLVVAFPFFLAVLISYFALLATRCSFICTLNYGIVPSASDSDGGSDVAQFPMIVAVINNQNNQARYLASGAMISPNWIVTSASQVGNLKEKDVEVRVGSNYWSMGGSIHKVQKLELNEEKTIVAIKIESNLPISTKVATISKQTLNVDSSVKRYFWRNNEKAPLRFRKKLVPIESKSMVIKKNDNGYYSSEPAENIVECGGNISCINYPGFPILDEDVLVGVNTGANCELSTNSSVYLIEDIYNSLSWIDSLIHGGGVESESNADNSDAGVVNEASEDETDKENTDDEQRSAKHGKDDSKEKHSGVENIDGTGSNPSVGENLTTDANVDTAIDVAEPGSRSGHYGSGRADGKPHWKKTRIMAL